VICAPARARRPGDTQYRRPRLVRLSTNPRHTGCTRRIQRLPHYALLGRDRRSWSQKRSPHSPEIAGRMSAVDRFAIVCQRTAAHGMQAELPFVPMYLPAAQNVHEEPALTEFEVPVRHGVQEVAPIVATMKP
jgi:hypothetical protein